MEENIQESPVTISVKKHIVVFGKHDYILKNVEDLLAKADFTTSGFTALPDALDYIKMNPLDAVFIGGGVDPHDRMEIQKLVSTDFPHVKMIEHFGGPATIITEVKSALSA
jgi:DNA-binding NtrC family response regulator